MKSRTIRNSDVARCPIRSLLPSHYNADGSCSCCGDLGAGQVTGSGPCIRKSHEDGQHRDASGYTWGGGDQ